MLEKMYLKGVVADQQYLTPGEKKTIQQMLRWYVKASFKGFSGETLEDYGIFNQHMKLVLAQ